MAKSQAVYVVESDCMEARWVRASTEEICDILNDSELYAYMDEYRELPHIYLTYISLDGSALNSEESQIINVECVAFKSKAKIDKINYFNKTVYGDIDNDNSDDEYDGYETSPSVVAKMTLVYTDEETNADVYVKFPMQLDGELPDNIYYCSKCNHLTAIKCHIKKCVDIDSCERFSDLF